MSETIRQFSAAELSRIFARLTARQVEEFYAAYQYWLLQQQMARVQDAMELLRAQMLETSRQAQQTQPSALILASLALLQSKGVRDLDVLERMLERGESWLDATMERLERCEQLGFIQDNYEEWCQHALEDAYDWIDSMETGPGGMPSFDAMDRGTSVEEGEGVEGADEAAEELLLQQARYDEDNASQITLKMRAVPVTPVTTTEEPGGEGGLLAQSEALLSQEDGITDGSLDTDLPGTPTLNEAEAIFMEDEGALTSDVVELARDGVAPGTEDTPMLQVELEALPIGPGEESGVGQQEAGKREAFAVPSEQRLQVEAGEQTVAQLQGSEQGMSGGGAGESGFVGEATSAPAVDEGPAQVERQRMLPAVIKHKPPLSYMLPRLPLLFLRKIMTRK